MTDRVPPHDAKIEQAVIGACLLSRDALDEVMGVVRSEHFYRPAHQRIYAAMCDLRNKGTEVDHLTLKSRLEADNLLDSTGGAEYLIEVGDAVTTPRHAVAHANIVREKAIYRSLGKAAIEIATLAYDAPQDLEAALTEANTKMQSVLMDKDSSSISIGGAFDQLVKLLKAGKQDFIAPPFLPWVHIKPRELVVVGAAPSVGKTAMSVSWADEWSKHKRVVYLEYEMGEIDLAARVAATHSGVTVEDMENGASDLQIQAIEYAAKEMHSTRSLLVDAVTCGIEGLIAKIRKEARNGAEVVFIDHLGLIPFTIPNGMNHAKAVGSVVTNRLKRLAVELNITVVLLSQIRRVGGGKPQMSDLRDSGEIEQDADKILMLWGESRDSDAASERVKERQKLSLDPFDDSFRLVHVNVVKYRNGALGEKYLRFYGETLEYEELHPPIPQVFGVPTIEQGELLAEPRIA